jgi:SAM-dependent methyltransferase
MNIKNYLTIVSYCEAYLDKYGDNFLGVGWTKTQEDVNTRYRVMLDIIRKDSDPKVTVLDFGCGASHLYEYIIKQKIDNIEYSGLDLSQKFLNLSKKKFPHITYYDLDIIENANRLPIFDYIIMNGVFTLKCDLSFEEMFNYLKLVVKNLFSKAKIGIAFNVMSKQVDWERDDLFHLPMDTLATFLSKEVSRHFVIRHDYGLYEYTTYVYKKPTSRE